MALPVHHLRGHVLHRPTERIGLLLLKYGLLAQTEICQLNMAFVIQQYATKEFTLLLWIQRCSLTEQRGLDTV